MTKDSYEPDSGGLLDHYVGTIEDAFFGTDSRYNNGETLLMFWHMRTDNPDVPEVDERFSCGGGWETLDGGKTAENSQGKTRFHPSSLYGKIIQRCVKEFEIRDLLEDRGESYEAKIWEGLVFEMGREDIDYGGEIGKRERLLPQKFAGLAGSETSPPGEKPAQVESGGNGETVAALLESLPDDLVEQLRAARQESSSHVQFVDRCMDLTGVVGNDILVRAIAVEDLLWKELA